MPIDFATLARLQRRDRCDPLPALFVIHLVTLTDTDGGGIVTHPKDPQGHQQAPVRLGEMRAARFAVSALSRSRIRGSVARDTWRIDGHVPALRRCSHLRDGVAVFLGVGPEMRVPLAARWRRARTHEGPQLPAVARGVGHDESAARSPCVATWQQHRFRRDRPCAPRGSAGAWLQTACRARVGCLGCPGLARPGGSRSRRAERPPHAALWVTIAPRGGSR